MNIEIYIGGPIRGLYNARVRVTLVQNAGTADFDGQDGPDGQDGQRGSDGMTREDRRAA